MIGDLSLSWEYDTIEETSATALASELLKFVYGSSTGLVNDLLESLMLAQIVTQVSLVK